MTDRFRFRVWDKNKHCFDEPTDEPCDLGVSLINSVLQEYANDKNYTLEQCTGLKDKNGKLIYENDVVEIMVWDGIEEDMVETKGKVYWSKEDASFLIYVSFDGEYPLYGQEIKVIGNIHENADLIKVGGK